MTAAAGLKRLGIMVAAAISAGILALAAISALIPADTVRDAVKAEIKAATGLDPLIRGDVAISLFPSGTVSFGDVALEDAGRTAFTAERLTAR
ncbi:MAG: AsmA family protein, partial [Bauldia sp.]